MSTQASILHDSPLSTRTTISTAISPVRILGWSIRRELWDNHSLYIAPSVVAALVLLGFFFGPYGIANLTRSSSAVGLHGRYTTDVPYDLASGAIMVAALLVGVFYSVDALYTERRDRSILFWKSLPVSDLTAVLAKGSIPLLVLPLIAFALAVVTHLIMAVVSSVALLRLGDPIAPFWSQLALPHMWLWLFLHLVTVTALWYAPLYAWLLLVSAFASRAPFLIAFLTPLAVAALEKIVFHTARVAEALGRRLAHANITASDPARGNTYFDPGSRMVSVLSLNTPELWLGLLAAVCFLGAAVQFRRYRGTL